MSIFSRIFKVGQASTEKVFERFEKPELMLDQAIRDKEEEIREAKQSLQDIIASEKQAKAQLDKEKAGQFKWEQQAQAYLKAGREDSAVKALQRANEFEQRVQALLPQWEAQRTSVEEIKRDILRMEDQVQEYRRNKDFILAQAKSASVRKDIYEAKARISKRSTADDLMARMKSRVERDLARAEAAKEISETFSESDELERELREESPELNPDIQRKLAEMKAKLGGDASAGDTGGEQARG